MISLYGHVMQMMYNVNSVTFISCPYYWWGRGLGACFPRKINTPEAVSEIKFTSKKFDFNDILQELLISDNFNGGNPI